jgi:hypothetical protein
MTTTEESGRGISRRAVVTGAGLAMAGGAAVVAGSGAVADAAALDAVGVAPEGTTAVEFRGRIAQTGTTGADFTSVGFLISARGAQRGNLFAGTPQAVGTALFTAYATGHLVARVLDQSVHTLDNAGELTVYQRTTPGADFAEPSSFQVGTRVATFALALQDVLAVYAPAQGLPTLTGDMRQTFAGTLSGALAGRQFGVRGQRLRMFATGLGTLTDPVTLNAQLEIAGSWTAE